MHFKFIALFIFLLLSLFALQCEGSKGGSTNIADPNKVKDTTGADTITGAS